MAFETRGSRRSGPRSDTPVFLQDPRNTNMREPEPDSVTDAKVPNDALNISSKTHGNLSIDNRTSGNLPAGRVGNDYGIDRTSGNLSSNSVDSGYDWGKIGGKPNDFSPATHGNGAHSANYVTSSHDHDSRYLNESGNHDNSNHSPDYSATSHTHGSGNSFDIDALPIQQISSTMALRERVRLIRDTPSGGTVTRAELRAVADLAIRALSVEVDAPDLSMDARHDRRAAGEDVPLVFEWRVAKSHPDSMSNRDNEMGQMIVAATHPIYANGHPDFAPGLS